MTGTFELWTAFLLGLVGSAHCAGMCGPLVLAMPVHRGPRLSFVTGRLVYNLGRITTYSLLGLIFGVLGQGMALAGLQRWTSIAAGLAILIGLVFTRTRVLSSAPVWDFVTWLKHQLGILLRHPASGSMFLLGALNGLLPCGLVYVAGAAAVSTGGLFSSWLFMACFGLGTAPLMLALALPGRALQTSMALRFRPLIPVTLAVVALLLIVRGLGLGIPYLSPALSPGSTCCH